MDLGWARAGIDTVLQAENDPRCLSVLTRHYPNVRRVNDVRVLNSNYEHAVLDGVELIHGGFPCQGISAGRDKHGAGGIASDPRSALWWEFARIIGEVQPEFVLIENVERIRNGRGGQDFRTVVEELRRLNYVGSGIVLDAAAFNLPARRPRVFFVARRAFRPTRGVVASQRVAECLIRNDVGRFVLEGTRQPRAEDSGAARPTRGSYRLLTPRECERAMGWPDDWTRWDASGKEIANTHRYRMIGNGVAAPVAEWLGHRLMELKGNSNGE